MLFACQELLVGGGNGGQGSVRHPVSGKSCKAIVSITSSTNETVFRTYIWS